MLAVWTLAALVVTTLRLRASSPRRLGTVVPATLGDASSSPRRSRTQMILGEDGGSWKLVVVLVILTALGYALTPILQRYWAAADAPPPTERLLGTVADVDVVAVPGDGTRCRSASARCVCTAARRSSSGRVTR